MDGLHRGARFLLANQADDGLWRDFQTPAGEASLWPTAFVGTALQWAGTGHDALARAAGTLEAAQRDDGGWGYNEDVPSDADSTAWALLFLDRIGGHERACDRAARRLVRYQRAGSGGIATYAEPGPIRRYMGVGRWMPFWGWCRPHIEVSAVGARALAGRDDAAADAAWRFVRAQQHTTGAWSSYWWTSPHYATAQAVELARGRDDRAAVERAAAWALGTDDAGSAFAAAMTLSILACAGAEAAERSARRLLALQQEDGGWPSRPVLRIPVPPDADPDREDRWRVVRFGGGIEVGDQHRLFTTAACVAALAR